MDLTLINKIDNNMKKLLRENDYTFNLEHNMTIKLHDQVVMYNSGSSWKIIPLIICLSYPIIYDKYNSDDEEYPITIAVCPITLRSAKFHGNFIFHSYQGITMILQEEKTDKILPIDSGHKIDKNLIIESNKRSEVKITTLRNALIIAPNILYMILNKNIKIKSIIDIDYYSNDKDINDKQTEYYIHPKTLCYIIQKKKFGSDKEKVYAILGKDATKNIITGYDSKKSGIFEYLTRNNEKLMKDNAYVFPMLWSTVKLEYPKCKVLYIAI